MAQDANGYKVSLDPFHSNLLPSRDQQFRDGMGRQMAG
jgi:hypothetical protein